MSRDLLLRYLREFQKDQTSRVFAPLADQYRKLGQPEEGLKICIEGLKHHPRYASGRVALANCRMDLGQHREALQEYENVLTHFPDNLKGILGAARCYQMLEETDKAIRYYRMYLFLVPADVAVRERLMGLEARMKSAKPVPPAPKTPSQMKLGVDPTDSTEFFSTLDHYRLSSLSPERPVQRQPVTLVSTPGHSSNKKISTLFTMLRNLRKQKPQDVSVS